MKKLFVFFLLIGFWIGYFVLFAIITAVYYKGSLAEMNMGPKMIDAIKNHFF